MALFRCAGLRVRFVDFCVIVAVLWFSVCGGGCIVRFGCAAGFWVLGVGLGSSAWRCFAVWWWRCLRCFLVLGGAGGLADCSRCLQLGLLILVTFVCGLVCVAFLLGVWWNLVAGGFGGVWWWVSGLGFGRRAGFPVRFGLGLPLLVVLLADRLVWWAGFGGFVGGWWLAA